jgi:hypothetical protein
LLVSLLSDSSPPSLELSPFEELSPLVLVDLVAVVDVEVVCTAAFSALVSDGGVISGVLLGTASETLLLPQAVTLKPSSAMQATIAARDLKAAPCDDRTWGSR